MPELFHMLRCFGFDEQSTLRWVSRTDIKAYSCNWKANSHTSFFSRSSQLVKRMLEALFRKRMQHQIVRKEQNSVPSAFHSNALVGTAMPTTAYSI